MTPISRIRGAWDRHRGDDSGFTLVEMLVTMVITLVVLALVPPILETAYKSTSDSQSISAGSGEARLAVQNLAAQVGSAIQICLPTTLTTTGPTVTSGFAVRVESLAFGRTQWDQWYLNTSTNQLEEQQFSTTWTSSNPVPPWVPVAQPVVNSSSNPPFSLPSTSTGSPENLAVTLYVTGGSKHTTQTVVITSTIAALSTPYAPSSPSQPCASTED